VSPDFDELVGAEATGAERDRLRHAHELLLQAGPPPELTPRLETAPNIAASVVRLQRRVVKRRAMLLLAAALSIVAVFAAGYAVANHRGGGTAGPGAPRTLALKGTAAVPGAHATLQVWRARNGNLPMTLRVVGLPTLPQHGLYEVYLVRDGRPWGSCGTFRVTNSSRLVTLTLNAPYALHKGDSWVVTRPAPGGEPGTTVLRPVSA
jgi:hypothetical protein